MPVREVLKVAFDHATRYREGVAERPVTATATIADLRASLGVPLTDEGVPDAQVVDELARAADAGLMGSAGPRYFGFVIGGSTPAALGADWLTSAWDQNAVFYATSPALCVVEEVAAGWLRELFGLPANASSGFVTGCQMAHFTALAAARHEVLRRAGWNVEADGLWGAPRVRVLVGNEVHVSVTRALRFLGMGEKNVERIAVDANGGMRPDALEAALAAGSGPTIVCAQSGNVDTGACDDLTAIARSTQKSGAWLHVDGAFGLWAAASPSKRHLVRGIELCDSWATDAHKWLNVPYDSGLVFCARPSAHRTAMTVRAPYLMQGEDALAPRDPLDWNPEFSRRGRGATVYAALRALGRRGVADLIDRCCAYAALIADRLRRDARVQVLNDVVLNQVLVRFTPPAGDADAFTRAVVARVQREGVCWLSGSAWRGKAVMRISVSGEATTEADAERTAAAILGALRREADAA